VELGRRSPGPAAWLLSGKSLGDGRHRLRVGDSLPDPDDSAFRANSLPHRHAQAGLSAQYLALAQQLLADDSGRAASLTFHALAMDATPQAGGQSDDRRSQLHWRDSIVPSASAGSDSRGCEGAAQGVILRGQPILMMTECC